MDRLDIPPSSPLLPSGANLQLRAGNLVDGRLCGEVSTSTETGYTEKGDCKILHHGRNPGKSLPAVRLCNAYRRITCLKVAARESARLIRGGSLIPKKAIFGPQIHEGSLTDAM